jgi:hypothetical protein
MKKPTQLPTAPGSKVEIWLIFELDCETCECDFAWIETKGHKEGVTKIRTENDSKMRMYLFNRLVGNEISIWMDE